MEHVEYREVTAGRDSGEMMMRLELVMMMMMTIVLSTAEYSEVVAGGGGGVAAEVQGCQPPPVGGRGLEASTPREITLHHKFQNSLKKEQRLKIIPTSGWKRPTMSIPSEEDYYSFKVSA